ncbi:MAG: hypothetical protein M1818_001530 [Claussenomyces sp. TS43310]|nr:MAG: hypothetical protein M1818_001530 [Claussenomyces sp. TS43310]
MSVTSEQQDSHGGFDSIDHQTSYVFAPDAGLHQPSPRPHKRRKVAKRQVESGGIVPAQFPSLFGGLESQECVKTRQRLFEDAWATTETQIQEILRDSNEVTLKEVADFVDNSTSVEYNHRIPTCLIVTGPNIASQERLFSQLGDRLRSTTNGVVLSLRSGDAPNLKTALKKLIRDATNQSHDEGDEDYQKISQKDGRKFLNYDLRLLENHVISHGSCKVVIAFQDSEAFDSSLLTDILTLFSSWLDRIPFVVMFGIATSLELFHERLPRAAIRCLHGAQFDVERTSKTLDKIFQKVIAGQKAALRFGSGFYAYMSHFYANPLSILLSQPESNDISSLLRSEHCEAIRMLPSFRRKIEALLDKTEISMVRSLLDSDEALLKEVSSTLHRQGGAWQISLTMINLLKALDVLVTVATSVKIGPLHPIELYITALSATLNHSDIITDILEAVKRIKPSEILDCIAAIIEIVSPIDSNGELYGMSKTAADLGNELSEIRGRIQTLDWQSDTLQSKYAVQQKAVRTTVVAQRVQLSKAKATLSKEDLKYTEIVDDFLRLLESFFIFESPQGDFLNEAWLYDTKSPNREVFTPKPRYSIERALCNPHDYLGCTCCSLSDGALSASQPPTAILYQLYLETGGLINVFDLWSAFYAIIGGEDGEDCEERIALSLFYKGLADLKFMGMVKQSRKKTDHLGKLAWKGL